jgi:CRISPR-associated protein Csd1
MIIDSLFRLYGRYVTDPDINIPRDGFSTQPISFEVVLELNGELHAISPLTTEKQPKRMMVLGDTKPSGSGINPCFLWDNPVYLLGIKQDDPKPERTLECYYAYRNNHITVSSEISNQYFDAVCHFLRKWSPTSDFFETLPDHIRAVLNNLPIGNGVFRIRNSDFYIHEIPEIKQWWSTRTDKKKWWEAPKPFVSQSGQCSVTGKIDSAIARLHEPKIKGVSGTNMAGASLVSFNDPAYNSYGFEQSRNASISESVAFAYCNALNRLLSREANQRILIGETTIVFWSEAPTIMEQSFLDWLSPPNPKVDEVENDESQDSLPLFEQSTSDENHSVENAPAQSAAKIDSLRTTLAKIARAEYANELGDPATNFYILALSPNAGRISVRNFSVCSLGNLLQNLLNHYNDLTIAHSPRAPDFPSLKMILAQTVRDPRDIPDLLVGPLFRSVVEGLPYPEALFAAIIRRIRADREVNSVRAGIIKATLNRKIRSSSIFINEEISVSLNPERPEPSYQLGRLFAALERNQRDALGDKLNATIKDRYFGSASATPASVFPRLIRLSQHHLAGLDGGKRVYAEKRMQEIMSRLNQFPNHLTLADQGLFAIGYYHQVQDFFTRKDAKVSQDEISQED